MRPIKARLDRRFTRSPRMVGRMFGSECVRGSSRRKTYMAVQSALESLEERRLLSAPNAPFALTATPQNGAVVVQFTDNASDETGFVVLRNNGGNSAYTKIATLPAAAGVHSVVSYTDSTTSANSTYDYEVYAVTDTTPSSTTGPVAVTTGSGGNN